MPIGEYKTSYTGKIASFSKLLCCANNRAEIVFCSDTPRVCNSGVVQRVVAHIFQAIQFNYTYTAALAPSLNQLACRVHDVASTSMVQPRRSAAVTTLNEILEFVCSIRCGE